MMNKETCMSDTAMHSCYLDLDKSSKYQNQGKGISLCLDLTAVNSHYRLYYVHISLQVKLQNMHP